ncbi:MAG: chemotaxis protein MotA [Proteobacteria bacterium]|nr:MAG: chemotaxis protein MotA [Pseudomonadota bacterium]
MGKLSKYGFATGLIIIVLGVFFSAAEPLEFLNVTGLIIVVGGLAAALFASYPISEIKRAFVQAKAVRKELELDDGKEIDQLFMFAVLIRRNNLRAAEYQLESIKNSFVKTGIQCLLDRVPAEEISAILNWRITKLKTEENVAARVFHSLSVYAPAFGMVGTLIGLVNMMLVMEQKSFDLVGANLAIALVTTFYGLLLANLVFKPVATKLERRTERRIIHMTMLLRGILLIAEGKTPAVVRDQLHTFTAHYDDELRSPGIRHSSLKPQAA